MDSNNHARTAQLRAISIYTQRPERAQVVNCGIAEVREGLSWTFEQDGCRLTLDIGSGCKLAKIEIVPNWCGSTNCDYPMRRLASAGS